MKAEGDMQGKLRVAGLLRIVTAPLLVAVLVTSCSSGKDSKRKKQTPTVGFVVVKPTNVALSTELPGRVTAFQMSEVRPQVAGIVQRRFFTEGSIVHQGQTLYQIDPSLYQASVAQTEANLKSAQANAEATRIRADRYKPLADQQAVSQQDYTDAAAQARQAAASVAQNNAQLQTARINLHFTRVPAPITGRIGRSLITEGGLVTTNQADPLAVIQRLDPIYVDIQQSSADLLALRRGLSKGGASPTSATVRLKLEDGSDYGQTGTIQFTEVMVDQATGSVTLRASFPNPGGILLPGMFVRAVFVQSVDTNAFLVPQQGLVRDPNGAARVWLVGPGDKPKAVQRPVTATRTEGANWVVTSGLKPGDKVITQGIANLKPKAVIKAVPAGSPERIGGARPGGKGSQGGGG